MLPQSCTAPSSLFLREWDFCEYLLNRPGFWHSIGCEKPKEFRKHDTPDFICNIYRTKKNERLGVEVEMNPSCFRQHGHDGFNVHLLVVLYTSWFNRKLKGIPIISLYRKEEMTNNYVWSLDDDIGMLFHNRESTLFEEAGY